MTSQQAAEKVAMLREVLETPDDDGPRLRFADWCEDNGEEARAKEIREGVEFGGLWGFVGGPDVRDWFPGTNIEAALFLMRRGFVDEVQMPLDVFKEHALALFEYHPITRVVLTDRQSLDGTFFRGTVDGPHTLPPWLFGELPCAMVRSAKSYLALDFDADDNAAEAVGHACVSWGRKQAGLPPIPWGEGSAIG